ncbi:hypothetical protein [Microbacterium thalli]|uniref:hypothetical protein n=1 Tax=Microbacterium thalli TaxID=3027921 RepID=UPI002365F1A3|nr:hypothetical protein [Microbacterium thalli]MDD7930106.1 hypothetical protein [Microbacterium thalli]
MNAREVNVLLTQAALLDGRLRRDPQERADMATAWSRVLADVSLPAGMDALAAHYREESRAVMPADIVARAGESETWKPAPSSVALADGPEWLRSNGVDPDEFQRRLDAGERPTRVLRELGVIEP